MDNKTSPTRPGRIGGAKFIRIYIGVAQNYKYLCHSSIGRNLKLYFSE